MEKMTVSQLFSLFYKHNEENNITSQFADKNALVGVIVFKSSNWPNKDFSLEERSYRFTSDNKYFISGMGGNSIFAESLDGSDRGIRLDWYLPEWEAEYAYLLEE